MPPAISSASNERVKHARRVRDGRETGLIFIEGLRLAEEALRSGIVVETALVDAEAQDARLEALVAQTAVHKVPVLTTSRSVLDALTDTVQSQGIIFIARRPQPAASSLFQRPGALLLCIDRVQDPGNMGTLLRTAEAAGVHGVIVLGGTSTQPAKGTHQWMSEPLRSPSSPSAHESGSRGGAVNSTAPATHK